MVGEAGLKTPAEILTHRLLSRMVKSDGCWEWTGVHDNYGYGLLHWMKANRKAHRLSYEYHVGCIPEGYVIDHLCNNKGCVNPDHLEPVTQAENVLRAQEHHAARRRMERNGELAGTMEQFDQT